MSFTWESFVHVAIVPNPAHWIANEHHAFFIMSQDMTLLGVTF